MSKFNVKAQVIHYVNGSPKKVKMVNQPYIYAVANRALYIKSGDINNTVLTVMCQHDKKVIEKDLKHLRVLVDTSGVEKLKKRHKSMLDFLGLDNLETLFREDSEESTDTPTIFMSINIFVNKYADKEKATLASITFRFMTNYPNKTETGPITDWYKIDANALCSVSNATEGSETDSTKPSEDDTPWQNNFVKPDIPVDLQQQHSDIAQRLEVLRCKAMTYLANDFDPSIKDITFLSGILEGLKEAAYRRNMAEAFIPELSNGIGAEIDARRVYKMSLKFLSKLEEYKEVNKDIFVLFAEAILALDLRSISRRLVFGEQPFGCMAK